MDKRSINEYGLRNYNMFQLKNWSNSRKIEIFSGKKSFLSFIQDAFDKKNLSKKMYFGVLNEETVCKVKRISSINLNNYNLSLSANEIRKITINSHGDKVKENLRGQIPITKDFLLKAPTVITRADTIELSTKKHNEKPVLVFRKMIEGNVTVVAYVSPSKHDLCILTMYATKKGTSATPTNV